MGAGQAMAAERAERLRAWLAARLGTAVPPLEPLAGDASFRRYFRLHLGGLGLVAVDAPPEREDSAPFVRLAGRLAALGVAVPRVLAADLAEGFLLVTDLGDTCYLEALREGDADALYGAALETLLRMQAGARPWAATLPPYDEALLRAELDLFPRWYLGRHLGARLGAAARRVLESAWRRLVAEALAQPRLFVHRDYHARNLMRLPEGGPGVLDFQDAVLGPATYDLVSLLRDCYIAWPPARVRGWALAWRAEARALGLLPDVGEARFLRWFDWMGVQRHLKAAGIFARLYHRDGKPGYLADIPRTLGYVTAVCEAYGELRPLGRLLADLGAEAAPCAP
ncbi:aminoglycoside phosphotransferase family protein [Inmirania thermothiophila]|uniref:Aminoglycoside phosphotransferase domain-containing protein n=1 Tax=Inmirania thermothiophila TaxID=1750597 RepID=A0A3N1Y785_9GAMM|nr:phosphotransferase [Inmirania thermothiophila]ROR34673.1 hypothetical protein EDC57_0574 [Inmirania thermothiophila]